MHGASGPAYDVLTRLPAMKAREAASLTPATWLAARSGKAARPAA